MHYIHTDQIPRPTVVDRDYDVRTALGLEPSVPSSEGRALLAERAGLLVRIARAAQAANAAEVLRLAKQLERTDRLVLAPT